MIEKAILKLKVRDTNGKKKTTEDLAASFTALHARLATLVVALLSAEWVLRRRWGLR